MTLGNGIMKTESRSNYSTFLLLMHGMFFVLFFTFFFRLTFSLFSFEIIGKDEKNALTNVTGF
jgi:hypothetical protein